MTKKKQSTAINGVRKMVFNKPQRIDIDKSKQNYVCQVYAWFYLTNQRDCVYRVTNTFDSDHTCKMPPAPRACYVNNGCSRNFPL